MKKTHKDRIDLLNRLERKYSRKVQLARQRQRQHIKHSLRAMRGRRIEEVQMSESPERIFRHDLRAA